MPAPPGSRAPGNPAGKGSAPNSVPPPPDPASLTQPWRAPEIFRPSDVIKVGRSTRAFPPTPPFTTWNPADKTAAVTLSNSNLTATSSGTNQAGRTVDKQTTGKFYWEITCATFTSGNSSLGIANSAAVLSSVAPTPTNACLVYHSGAIWLNNVNTGLTLGALTSGNVIGIALDLANQAIWFRLGAAGNWNGNASSNPASNTGGVNFSSIGGGGAAPIYPCYAFGASAEQFTANFGDTAFVGAVPSGFTSGFPAGASVPTRAIVTQVALEEWVKPNPPALVTQVALEVWGSVALVAAGAGEADAFADVRGAGAAAAMGAGSGQVDAGATVSGAGIAAVAGRGEADAFADVEGAGALVVPPNSLPILPGLGWSVHRRPTFDTIVVPHPSGAEVRLALWAYPLWEFELTYDALSSNGTSYPGAGSQTLQTLMGFYLARGGQRATFLYVDPDFNQMVGQGIGAGDGVTVAFPFMRAFGGFIEPVSWVTSVSKVYLDGAPVLSGWAVSGATLTFAVAPASGVVIRRGLPLRLHLPLPRGQHRFRAVHDEPLAIEVAQVPSGAPMKPASSALKAYLDAARGGDASLTIADCFAFTLAAGQTFNLTNYDQSIAWNGMTFVANAVLVDGLKYKTAVGLEVDKQQITLAAYPTTTMNGAPVMQAIAQGAFDGARVQRYRVFISPYLTGGVDGVLLFQGRVSTVDGVGRTHAKLTVASDLAVLEFDMPHNLFSPTCSHVLYDQGCGVNKGLFTFSGNVGAGSSQSTILWGGANVGMLQGALNMQTGLNAGIRATIKAVDPGVALGLLSPLPSPVAPGDLFVAYFGCDHTMATCKAKFNNVVHFRGFPFVPPTELTV